jgi:HEAT repeat protein
MNNELKELQVKLMNAHWPKCNEIAEQVFSYETDEAKEVLISALKAKRHHIRTAAIRSLAKYNDSDLAEYIKPLLNDPAYETRMEAEKAIHILSGE